MVTNKELKELIIRTSKKSTKTTIAFFFVSVGLIYFGFSFQLKIIEWAWIGVLMIVIGAIFVFIPVEWIKTKK